MNPTEKAIIKKIILNLQESTIVKWEMGDLSKFSEWAKKMKEAIRHSTSILDGILQSTTNEKETPSANNEKEKDLLS